MEDKNKRLSWDAHFWLGLETTQDEAGAAAIYTVQLDDALGGSPVQHREVQEQESQLFTNYFKNSGGIKYQPGGVDSGFRKTVTNAAGEKRLFQVKGKKNIRVRQVDLTIGSMNKGDCFVLDAGNKVYVYVGPKAKRVEKIKATSFANQVRDEDHHGRSSVEIVDEFSNDIDKAHYFEILGSGSIDQVPDESIGGDDDTFERSEEAATTLSKVSDATGTLKVEPISQKPLKQEMLNTNDCFILDTGSGIYVWLGKKATEQEKKQAMSRGQGLIAQKKYPQWTKVAKINEFTETAPFKQYFFTWRDHGASHSRLI
jgi:gelsolin